MGLVQDTARRIAGALGIPAPWLLATASVAAGLALGWLARAWVRRTLVPIAERTRTELDDVFARALATPVGLSIASVGIWAAVRLVTDAGTAPTVDRALRVGIVVIWGLALAGLTADLLLQTARQRAAHIRGARLFARFAKIVIGVVVLLTAMAMLGFEITPLVAGAGIAGIALALAAQETLANLFAGLAVYLDRLYQVGDFVVLGEGTATELRGEVRDVGLRSTRILTLDDVLVIVPNSAIANSIVINESAATDQYRIRIPVGVAYASDLDHVERVLAGVGSAHALALPTPPPRVRVRSFGAHAINLELLVWVQQPRTRGLVIHELSKSIHKTFREEGIEIPFPQREVRMLPHKGDARAP